MVFCPAPQSTTWMSSFTILPSGAPLPECCCAVPHPAIRRTRAMQWTSRREAAGAECQMGAGRFSDAPVRLDLPAAAAAGAGGVNYILTQTGKGLYGNNREKSTAALIRLEEKGREALKRKGWNTLKKSILTLETFLLQAAVICGILETNTAKRRIVSLCCIMNVRN